VTLNSYDRRISEGLTSQGRTTRQAPAQAELRPTCAGFSSWVGSVFPTHLAEGSNLAEFPVSGWSLALTDCRRRGALEAPFFTPNAYVFP
jgi:hypothetical protein